jgi:hypothetical protein
MTSKAARCGVCNILTTDKALACNGCGCLTCPDDFDYDEDLCVGCVEDDCLPTRLMGVKGWLFTNRSP